MQQIFTSCSHHRPHWVSRRGRMSKLPCSIVSFRSLGTYHLLFLYLLDALEPSRVWSCVPDHLHQTGQQSKSEPSQHDCHTGDILDAQPRNGTHHFCSHSTCQNFHLIANGTKKCIQALCPEGWWEFAENPRFSTRVSIYLGICQPRII